MIGRLLLRLLLPLLMLAAATSPATTEDAAVDVALVLAMDVSYSVDSFEHRLQMQGFAQAIQSEEVMKAIRNGKHQRIAITLFQWSDPTTQQLVIPWTTIANEADAAQIAATLMRDGQKVYEGGTAITAALLYASDLFVSAPMAERRVIDVATDGRNNIGRPVKTARDVVVAQGITINGLAISNEWRQLTTYLEKQVIGGNLSFVEEAKTYDDFGAAMLRKLVREITGPGMT